MKSYTSEYLRTLALVGHGGTGKTSLVSAILFDTGMVNRLGKVDQGNTVTDFEEEEIERKTSIQAAVAFAVRDKYKINLIDTPGYSSFSWEARLGLRASELGMMLVSAADGVQVQTERIFDASTELNKPMMFVVNKIKKELSSFGNAVASIQDTFGKNAIPVQLPVGDGPQFRGVVDLLSGKCFLFSGDEKGTCREEPIPAEMEDEVTAAREALAEKVAECDEQLMETYLEQGELSQEDLRKGLRKALREREVFPILATDALANIGIQPLLDFVLEYAPSILEISSVPTEPEIIVPREDGPPMAMVFKTISDPFSGKISIMKVFTGVVKNDSTFLNINKDSEERVGHLFGLQGKTQDAVETEVHAGDIVAVAKLKETQTGDTLAAKGTRNRFQPFKFPIPSISYAIEPKSRNDEGKISTALQRISEEDPTLHMERDPQTKELVISGNGEIHVKMIVNKLKKKYGVDVDMKPPKIPYLETITGHSDINKKYKKQSGGRGQYGHVMIKMDPLPRGEDFVFEETIFGGSVPKNYIPAVEKGVLEARERGVLAGYRLVDFKVNLYDGSYHDVDSSEMAFKIAASMAFKLAAKAAKPVLLEPIMAVEVVIPSEFMGDISGTISGRRGRIQGMEQKGKNQVVRAMVPMSEMLDFNPVLTSITGGRGDYSMEFAHYEQLPSHLQQKVIDEAVREGRIREEEED